MFVGDIPELSPALGAHLLCAQQSPSGFTVNPAETGLGPATKPWASTAAAVLQWDTARPRPWPRLGKGQFWCFPRWLGLPLLS